MSRATTAVLAGILLAGVLFMPVHAQSGGQPLATTHIVERGETLFSIARRHGLTVEAIAHANGITDPRHIYVGQLLTILSSAAGLDPENSVPYVVQAGDTLAAVARRHRATWQALVRLNRLVSPNSIYVGQIIQVPSAGASPDDEVEGGSVIASPEVNGGTRHIVRSDDTMFRIALRYGVSPWAIAQASHTANPALIYQGQELLIPNSDPGLLPEPLASIQIRPLPAMQGATVIIRVRTSQPVSLSGRLLGNDVLFGFEEDAYHALVGVHVFTEPGLFELELTAKDADGQATHVSADVLIQAGRFGYEQIDVPASQTNLLDPETITAERELLNALRYTFSEERRWTAPLHRPATASVSSHFGTHRSYDGGPYTSYHSGVDFRAPSGAPVSAPADGTVILAQHLAIQGNSIIIDHGWGLLTGYWHLSEMEVDVGQRVDRGAVIGKVGNTGRSTGAHLHWEVWVGGISVNGLEWLQQPQPWVELLGTAVGG